MKGPEDLHRTQQWSSECDWVRGTSGKGRNQTKVHRRACGWMCAGITVLAATLRQEGKCEIWLQITFGLARLAKESLIPEGTSFEERVDRTPKDISKWINGCKWKMQTHFKNHQEEQRQESHEYKYIVCVVKGGYLCAIFLKVIS